MLSNGCLSKKNRSTESIRVTIEKNIVFHYVLGGLQDVEIILLGYTPNGFQLAMGFSKKWEKKRTPSVNNLRKSQDWARRTNCPRHLTKLPPRGKKQKLVGCPAPFQNGFGEGEPAFQSFVANLQFRNHAVHFFGYNKKKCRIPQQQRIETAHQVAREIFKPCHPQRPRHPQHATETVALFNW